jgi:hypothetical protein
VVGAWRFGVALVLLGAIVVCRTREDAARKIGRSAALTAARACSDAASTDDACRERLCREQCADFADSVALRESCTSRCTGQGTCDSDADCDQGLICVMIAPRLRRCVAPRASDAEAP